MMTYTEFRNAHENEYRTCDGSMMDAYHLYFKENAQVGDGATVHLYSDAEAYTIIKRTANTLTLRRCKATHADGWKPEYIPGGFSAICINDHEQKWQYEEDENGAIVKANWSNRDCRFRVYGSCTVSYGRHERYDYNF